MVTREELDRLIAESSVSEAIATLARRPEIRGSVLDAEFLRPAHDCIVMTETPNGLRYFFSLRDTYVGMPIAVGVFERDVDEAIARLLRPGMNCIDAGANLGYYSMRMAAVVAQGAGRVFSFEPDPFACGLLHKNCRENRFENVINIFPFACGERSAEALLFRDPDPRNYGGTHVRESGSGATHKIAVRRVDDLVPSDVPIHFVKIDVEGYELFALQGMKRIIREHHPAIVMEFNPHALESLDPSTPRELLDFIAFFGYTVYEADQFRDQSSPRFNYAAAPGKFTNLVCLPS